MNRTISLRSVERLRENTLAALRNLVCLPQRSFSCWSGSIRSSARCSSRTTCCYGYDEIAVIVRKGEANCRQLVSRARRHVRSEQPRFEATREQRDDLATRFFAAFTEGDMDGLVELPAVDARTYGDGGGKAPQWSTGRQPTSGADRLERVVTAPNAMRPASSRAVCCQSWCKRCWSVGWRLS